MPSPASAVTGAASSKIESSGVIAAEAEDFVDAAYGSQDALGHLLQRSRAGQVAVSVVDGLEVVKVEKDDAAHGAVAAGTLDLLVEIRLEEAAVVGLARAGQPVIEIGAYPLAEFTTGQRLATVGEGVVAVAGGEVHELVGELVVVLQRVHQ